MIWLGHSDNLQIHAFKEATKFRLSKNHDLARHAWCHRSLSLSFHLFKSGSPSYNPWSIPGFQSVGFSLSICVSLSLSVVLHIFKRMNQNISLQNEVQQVQCSRTSLLGEFIWAVISMIIEWPGPRKFTWRVQLGSHVHDDRAAWTKSTWFLKAT